MMGMIFKDDIDRVEKIRPRTECSRKFVARGGGGGVKIELVAFP